MHHHMALRIFDSPQEASAAGHVYRAPEYVGLTLETAVLVRNGTTTGSPTVDLILIDPITNQKYVALITRKLLAMIPEA
jgi:hypothetical protein